MERKRNGFSELYNIGEVIINEVKNFPCLYNTQHKEYRNVNLKNKIWNDLAAKIGLEAEIVIKKWSNLRDRYIKEKKKILRGANSGRKRKKWDLYDMLQFLDDFSSSAQLTVNNNFEDNQIVAKCEFSQLSPICSVICDISDPRVNYIENVLENLDNEQASTSTDTTSVPLKKKIKKEPDRVENSMINFLENIGNDEYYHFCMSLVPIFKRLPSRKAATLKLKIMETCNSIEFDDDL